MATYQKKTCIHCGCLKPLEDEFCPVCGKNEPGECSWSGKKQQAQQPKQAPASGGTDTTSTKSSGQNTCRFCGYKLSTADKFCPSCGKHSQTGASKCQKCGQQVARDMKFCGNCGQAINGQQANARSTTTNTTPNIVINAADRNDLFVNERNPLAQSSRNAVVGCMTPVLIGLIFLAVMIILAIIGSFMPN